MSCIITYSIISDAISFKFDSAYGDPWPVEPISTITVLQTYQCPDAVSFPVYTRPSRNKVSACNNISSPTYIYENKVILIPSDLDSGNIVSEQRHTISLWYYFEKNVPTFDSYLGFDADGTSIDLLGNTLPKTNLPYEEVQLDVVISQNGPPVLDGSYVFYSSGGIENTLTMSGLRIKAFDAVPDWAQGIKEKYEWKSYMVTAYDGQEQRIAARPDPLMKLGISYLVHSTARQEIDNKLLEWQDMPFLVPMWQYHRTLASAASAASTQITIKEGLVEHFNQHGDLALLYGGPGNFEVVTHDSDDGIDTVTLKYQLANDWPAGTQLIPAKVCYTSRSVKASLLSPDVARYSIEWQTTEPQSRSAAEISSISTPAGDPIFDRYPLSQSSSRTQMMTKRFKDIYFESSGFVRDSISQRRTQLLSYEILAQDEAEAVEFLHWAFARRGRQVAVYAPSFKPDCVLAEEAVVTSSSFKIKNIGLSKSFINDPDKPLIFIRSAYGTFASEISSVTVDADPAKEVISLVQQLTFDLKLSDVYLEINFLKKRKLSSDTFVMHWLRPGLCKIAFALETAQ